MMLQKEISRREFLKTAGIAGAGLAAAGLAGCGPQATPTVVSGPTKTDELKLQLISHFVAGYDDWIKQFATDWGTANGVTVTVDFVGNLDLAARGAAEVAAQKGHDIVQWDQAVSSPFLWKNHTVDLTDLVKEMEGEYGEFSNVAQQAGFDGATGTWFSLPIFYMAFPSLYRKDLWDQVGGFPDTWDKVLEGGRELKAMGNPVGIPISHGSDGNVQWRGLIWSYGGSIQDEGQNVVINSPEVLEAVKFARALYQETMTDEVMAWDDILQGAQLNLIFLACSLVRWGMTISSIVSGSNSVVISRTPAGHTSTQSPQPLHLSVSRTIKYSPEPSLYP